MAPQPYVYPPAPRPSGAARTWWWFLIPLFTFGFASFVMVFVGARKLRSKPHTYAAAGYLVATVVCVCGLGVTGDPASTGAATNAASTLFAVVYFFGVWLGGTAHTAVLSYLVARLDPASARANTLVPHAPDPAVAAAARRVARRQEARGLLAANPALAWELRIGRPDISGRHYDDGGLVDINHVPADWIAYALQLPPELAQEIVTARDDRPGGFSSADELVLYCDHVTPEMLTMIGDMLVFRPV